MPSERFFLDSTFVQNQSTVIKDLEFHHLVHVMRNKAGDQIELVNGQGQLAEASIESINKKQCEVLIEIVHQEDKPTQEIILVQSIPRPNRLDFIIEKGVELGMTQIWLLPAAHSERKTFNEQQLERMKIQMIAAMKQCGRLYLPKLELVKPLHEMKSLPFSAYFGDTQSGAPAFSEVFLSGANSSGILFFTGPESGFTSAEIGEMQRLEVKGVKLHPNILRTDTASLMALSLISHWFSYSQGSSKN